MARGLKALSGPEQEADCSVVAERPRPEWFDDSEVGDLAVLAWREATMASPRHR
jgi:hypothetical protein